MQIVDLDQENDLSGSTAEALLLISRLSPVDTSDQTKDDQVPEGLCVFSELIHTTETLPGTYTIKLEPNAKGVVHAARHLRVESNSSRKLLTSSVKFNPIVTNNKSGRANLLGQLHGSLHSGDKIRICDLNKVSHRQIQMTATSLQSQVRTRQIFQRVMDQILEGTEGETAIMDDTLIAGRDVEHHDAILHKVIERATSYKLKLNLQKCSVRQPEVPYIRHLLNSEGLKPDPSKVVAVHNMPTPQTKEDLRRFLGLVTYLGKFILNLSELDAALRDLLKTDCQPV